MNFPSALLQPNFVKFTFPTLLGLGAAALLLTGCASQADRQREQATDAAREAGERKPPFVGMTQSQALARYGEPKTRSVTSKGEQWTYLLNFGEMMGRALIPFNFKPTMPRTGVLTFGPDGRVSEFRWDQETNG